MSSQPKKKMSLKERLEKSLQIKRENLLKKRDRIQAEFDAEMHDVKEKLEVIDMQLSGLKK